MSSATTSHPDLADPADQQAGDALYYRWVLHELIDMGVDIARAVHQQATAQADPADPASAPVDGVAVAFDRISRSIRRTVALACKIAEPLPVRAAAGQQRVAARRQIIREVEDVIQREVGGAEAEALGAELHERLDGPELDDEIGNRPVAEVIAEICHDLGLLTFMGNHPWKRRTPQDIAALCARAAQPRAVPSPGVASPTVAHAVPERGETGVGPPSPQRDAGADLLRFTFPVRGT